MRAPSVRLLVRLTVVLVTLLLVATACQQDNPETPLPCAFYQQQLETAVFARRQDQRQLHEEGAN